LPFATLGLGAKLTQALAEKGYVEPTPIQAKAIPVILSGRDVIGVAQTGTGKTAAFVLPLLERLANARPERRMRVLVIAPTRELVAQIEENVRAYGKHLPLAYATVFGGVGEGAQIQALRRGVDLVVATPGRLIDLTEQRHVDYSALEVLVLDEADRMLDMGFLPPLRRILKVLPRDRQTLLFSATISDEVRRLSTDFTRDPARVDVSEGHVMASTVTHRVHPVSNQHKGDLLTHVLKETPGAQALVFCKTKHGSNKVGQYLERAGINAAVIHGNKSQGARTKALGDFKAGRVSVLVATDIAARGLDIAQLPLVVNFDLPLVASDYIHRAGRTGRAGLSGRAVSLVSPEDRNLLRDIQRLLPAPIEHITIDGFAVTASSHEALPDAGRRHQGRRPGRGFSGSRSGARHGSGGSGRRPSRPGGSRSHAY
jgi:ATP-dependent RNA helicase RhlE